MAKKKVSRQTFDKEMKRLQIELCTLQDWVVKEGLRIVVVFEGRDAAGKGGVIKRIAERVSPRVFRVVALPTPTEREKSQMYAQRYLAHFPAAGEVILFDRSWYNRAGVERVMDFCTDDEYYRFLRMVPQFEQNAIEDGIILIKYFLDVSQDEQEKRFKARAEEQSWPTSQGFDEYRVGVRETSDSALYRGYMERAGFPEAVIAKAAPQIWEGDSKNGLKAVREYTTEYRKQVEGDITKASIKYIKERAKKKEPFFLYVGFTHTHYPVLTAPQFEGASPAGPYGDAVMELDYRTGEVLDAIKAAGIEDNTIVIWLSDDGASPMGGPLAGRGGSNGIFAGELGDGLDGSIRTPAMIKWPGKIKPSKSNGMVSIHDFFSTLGNIIGAEIPDDRAIDSIDQTDFFLGKQENSNRESVLSFLGDEIVAVRWRNYRMYPKNFTETSGNPSMGGAFGARTETNGNPLVFNIFSDPKEEHNIIGDNAWVMGAYLKAIGAYKKSLVDDPAPKAFSLTHP